MIFEHQNDALRWIVLIPLLAVIANAGWALLARRAMPRALVIALGCGAPLLSLAIALRSVYDLTQLPESRRFFVDGIYTWLSADPFHVELAFLLDPLSAVMLLVVTGVGALIHLYAVGYMQADSREDRGFQRFFLYMNLLLFSMLLLVLGDNLIVLFAGWEGVALCSYLLIGFWYLDDRNAYAAHKALLVNRLGDVGFLLGILLLFWSLARSGHPTLEFREMALAVDVLADARLHLPDRLAPTLSGLGVASEWRLLTVVGLLLFAGAVAKSAQLPLCVWPPDAVAGPTPASALIYAATTLTAGVYLICRMSFVYSLAPGALATVAWTGALTALVAAAIASAQNDVKKVLACATISQLGYLFLAAGVAGYGAAVFHLVTHAFFMALLFLGAGSVILAMHHEQRIDRMGGLRRRMPWTFWTFLIGTLGLAGLPPSTALFSRDQLLLGVFVAQDTPGYLLLYAIGVSTAGLTAFYAFRLVFRVFAGESRASLEVRTSIREGPGWMLFPLCVLSGLSLLGGFVGFPQAYTELQRSNSLHHFLQPLLHSAAVEPSPGVEYALAAGTLGSAGLGLLAAALLYHWRVDLQERLRTTLPSLHGLLESRLYLDELYDAVFVRPILRFSSLGLDRWVEARLIDRLGVEGVAALTRGLALHVLRLGQTGLTQSYVFVMLIGGVVLIASVLGAF